MASQSLQPPLPGSIVPKQGKPCAHGGAFFDIVGRRYESLERAKEAIPADVLDAWFDPSPSVIATLGDNVSWFARTSPPTACEGVMEAIAEHRGLDEETIVVGAGSSDLIFRACSRLATIEAGRGAPGQASGRALVLDPMYGEYAHVLGEVVECRVERLRLRPDQRFELDLDALLQRVQRGIQWCALVNPNSPTGRSVDSEALRGVIEQSPQTFFWVDETYSEYIDADGNATLEKFATECPNLVVCKSMSKVYALSGLRAAYLVTRADRASELRRWTPPWAMSGPAQAAAIAALADKEYYRDRWSETHRLRRRLAGSLREAIGDRGERVLESEMNFVIVRLGPSSPTADQVVARCALDGVFLRDMSTMGSLDDRWLRIAVRSEDENERMVRSVASALSETTCRD